MAILKQQNNVEWTIEAVRYETPPTGVLIRVLDENGNLLGEPFRIFDPETTDGRVRGDTPGVNGSYFHVNGSNQIELAGR